MEDPRRRTGRLLAALVLIGVVVGASACSLVTGRVDRPTGNSVEVNQELAAGIPARIADALPGAEARLVNYRDDITLQATLAISVVVPDLPAALAAVSNSPTPGIPDFTEPNRPLAPIAARIVQPVWSSEIYPVLALVVEVRVAGQALVIDTLYVGVTESDDTAALQEAFGPRP